MIEGVNSIRNNDEAWEYSLTGEPAKEYPQVPPFKGSSEFAVESSALRKLIHRTSFAVSTDELRPAMMGILFQAGRNQAEREQLPWRSVRHASSSAKEPDCPRNQ